MRQLFWMVESCPFGAVKCIRGSIQIDALFPDLLDKMCQEHRLGNGSGGYQAGLLARERAV